MTVNSDRKARDRAARSRRHHGGFRGSLVFDAGSTTGAVGRASRASASPRPARSSRSSPTPFPIAHALSLIPDIGLTVLGGQVRGLTAAAVGAATVGALEALRPDVAFIGTNGISAEFGLSTPDPDEARGQDRHRRGGAPRGRRWRTSPKFGVESLVRFAALDDIDVLVTDEQPDAALAAALAEADVEVWIA